MVSFVLILCQFWRALRIATNDAEFRSLGIIVGALLLVGTIEHERLGQTLSTKLGPRADGVKPAGGLECLPIFGLTVISQTKGYPLPVRRYRNQVQSWVILRHTHHGKTIGNGNHRPDDVRRSFDETLKKLGLDYLDLFLIHWPLPTLYGG